MGEVAECLLLEPWKFGGIWESFLVQRGHKVGWIEAVAGAAVGSLLVVGLVPSGFVGRKVGEGRRLTSSLHNRSLIDPFTNAH